MHPMLLLKLGRLRRCLATIKIYRQLKMSSFMQPLSLINFDYWSELRDTGPMEECRNYLTKHLSDFDTLRDRVNGEKASFGGEQVSLRKWRV